MLGIDALLLIDDNVFRQRQLRTVLATLGYKTSDIENVETTDAGMTLVKRRRFACCFVALSPDSFRFVREVRSNEFIKTIPIIIYSGESTRQNVLTAVQAGATAFLAYPFSASDVEELLRDNKII